MASVAMGQPERSRRLRELAALYRDVAGAAAVRNEAVGEPFDRLATALRGPEGTASVRRQPSEEAVLVVAYAVLCIGVDPHERSVDAFWASRGLGLSDAPCEARAVTRLEYLVERLPHVLSQGPVLEMATELTGMRASAFHASRHALPRALHALYRHRADCAVSADPCVVASRHRGGTRSGGALVSAADYVALFERVRRQVGLG